MGKCFQFVAVLLSLFLHFSSGNNSCSIEKSKRVRCGPRDITQDACENIRCCYSNVDGNSECFFSTDSAPRFSIWSSWKECSTSCGGGGTQRRDRACLYEGGHQAPDELCLGKSYETKSCNTHRCGEEKVEEAATCIERFTARCRERKSECASNKDLQRDCPLTCNTCQQPSAVKPTNAPPSKLECRDISPTCGTAKELCFRGFLSDTFRKWCRKTCNNCEAGTLPVDIVTPTSAVTPTAAPTLPPTQNPLSVCVDEFKTCDRVASLCGMPKHRRELTLYCRRTCNLCFVEPRSTVIPGVMTPAVTIATATETPAADACADKAPNCANWQQLCGKNVNVDNLCEKTCGFCHRGSREVTTTQKVVETTTAAPEESREELVEVCEDQVSDKKCSAWKVLCTYHAQTRSLCRKTCGECKTTEGEQTAAIAMTKPATTTPKPTTTKPTTTKPTTTKPTTTKPTTTKPTTTKPTTTKPATTPPTTARKVEETSQPRPGCKDRYKNCQTIQRHCDIDSYQAALRKHCAFTCNFDNCRRL